MIRTKDGLVEIELRADCWELRHFRPKKPTAKKPNPEGMACDKMWFATLDQAARRALDRKVHDVGLETIVDTLKAASDDIVKAVKGVA